VRVRAEEGPADEAAIQQGLEAQDDRDAAVQQQAKEYKAFNATLEVRRGTWPASGNSVLISMPWRHTIYLQSRRTVHLQSGLLLDAVTCIVTKKGAISRYVQ